jgi:predicted O-methyltransferase YrrM
MKNILKRVVAKLPYISKLEEELNTYKTKYPPGHFYSPLPSIEEVKRNREQIFSISHKEIPGIDLHEASQLALLDEFRSYYSQLPFTEQKQSGLRYYFNNRNYTYSDAVFTYSAIRHFKPRRIIEVGSGFSSALMLDVNDIFFEGKIHLLCIEPYPELVLSLAGTTTPQQFEVVKSKLQEVDINVFKKLDAGDILFIDSTHVSKIGSDVNYLFFEILPALKSGVLIHIHDIFFPFEYPESWVVNGRAWNESYLLRAFLQYNTQFSVLIFNSFLQHYHQKWFSQYMPLCLRQLNEKTIAGSIWLQKH